MMILYPRDVILGNLTLLRLTISGHDTRRRLRRTIRGDKTAIRTDPSEAAQENFEFAAVQMRGNYNNKRRRKTRENVERITNCHGPCGIIPTNFASESYGWSLCVRLSRLESLRQQTN